MKRYYLLILLLLTAFINVFSQGFPWERPLNMAWSANGTTFNTPTIFQDSSGVPSVIRWKGDTLVATFQWFRVPIGSLNWDRVAVKFSYDNGNTWTTPTAIVVNGLPSNYQRPFDPTLFAVNNDSLRIYFSSSNGIPQGGLDSTVNTYSAISTDGIQYTFESNARVDVLSNRVIDPAVIYFGNGYHYASPIGSPQQGAYHYVSPDGLNFISVPNINSDNMHNWTGNYMINDTNELRFYGAGQGGIWYNSTPNGGVWNGYVNTNIQGGDPSVLKVSATNYLMVYVGSPYANTSTYDVQDKQLQIYPNPATQQIMVNADAKLLGSNYTIYNYLGSPVLNGSIRSNHFSIPLEKLDNGIYMFSIDGKVMKRFTLIK